MDHVQWKSAQRSARLGRRREAFSDPLKFYDSTALRPANTRGRAVWAVLGVGMAVATLAFWRVQPGASSGESLAVNVPAASSPAAADPAAIRS